MNVQQKQNRTTGAKADGKNGSTFQTTDYPHHRHLWSSVVICGRSHYPHLVSGWRIGTKLAMQPMRKQEHLCERSKARMKVVIFEVESWERDGFEQLQKAHEVVFVAEPLTMHNATHYQDADIISPFIYSNLSANTLQHFTNLKLIATRSTGFDHIDSDHCHEHGVTVCNVPTYGDNTVAEHVFGLLLAISHNLIAAVDRTRRGDFSQQGLRGFDLADKTLGVIGTGSIGRNVIRIAGGFGMQVLAYDINQDEALASRLNFTYADMDYVLEHSDIITLHVPSNKHTYHLISHEQFDRMKNGVVIINTARGNVMDVHALVKALGDKKVAAAGLDVLPDEPTIREEAELLRSIFRQRHDIETLLADHILLRLRNVIITPHSAFNTREAIQRIVNTTITNIEAFLQGNAQHVVLR
jgi:D-lactate dehydrogenase